MIPGVAAPQDFLKVFLEGEFGVESNWRSSHAFYIVPKKIQGLTKVYSNICSITPTSLPNLDWSITMIFMQLTTQLTHYPYHNLL